MRPNKNISLGKDKYYFTIKSTPNNITIYRSTRKAAADAFLNYRKIGKDCEWLGKWNGKKFEDSTTPVANTAN
jgi:hypothetical protein